jgi:hypothetical protein
MTTAAVAPPEYDHAIERAILGAPLMEPETLDQVLAVPAAQFFDERHRLIHGAMCALHAAGQPIDLVMLSRQLRTDDMLEVVGGPAYLAQLFEEGSIPAHIAGYVEQLVDLWRKRRLLQLGMTLTQEAQNGHRGCDVLKTAAGVVRELTAAAAAPKAVPLGVGAGAFLAQTFPDTAVYVEGLLSSDGSGWIAGEEKLGKSLFALDEAVSLALGLPVCGRFVVPQRRRVLFLEEEDPPRRTQTRLAALLRGRGYDVEALDVRVELDRWLHVEVWAGFSFDEPAMIARLEAAILAFEPAVIYVDVLRKMTAADLNKADQIGVVLRVLDDLRRRHDVVFRVLHHNRKIQGGFRAGRGSQELAGSFVLGAWAECSLFFEPIGRKQGAVRVSVQTKDGAPVPSFRLVIQGEGPLHAPTILRLTAEDDDARSTESDVDELVFQAIATLPKTDALAGKPGVLRTAVIAAVTKSDKTIRRAINRLEDAGRVLVTGNATKRAALYGVKD